MKKIISVLLAVLMIAGCMAISFSAMAEGETIVITGVKEPKVGEAPNTSTEGISISDGYTIKKVTYYEELVNIQAYTSDFDAFQAGKYYRVVIAFEPNINAGPSVLPTATVNGKSATLRDRSSSGTYRYEVEFVFGVLEAPADPEPTASVCAWCGGDHSNGFFQMIIGWFHGILASLFGARF